MKEILIIVLIATMIFLPVTLAAKNQWNEPLKETTIVLYKDGRVSVTGDTTTMQGSCFGWMGYTLKTPQEIVINPGSYDASFVVNAIASAAMEWDSHTSRQIFKSVKVDYSTVADDVSGQIDGKNEYTFASLPDSNIIAVTKTRYLGSTRELIDYDITFNTKYYWADCAKSNCASAMDLQNIATHETGHALGLADVYSSSCSSATMYGYSGIGDTKKRTIEQSDINILQKLYGR